LGLNPGLARGLGRSWSRRRGLSLRLRRGRRSEDRRRLLRSRRRTQRLGGAQRLRGQRGLWGQGRLRSRGGLCRLNGRGSGCGLRLNRGRYGLVVGRWRGPGGLGRRRRAIGRDLRLEGRAGIVGLRHGVRAEADGKEERHTHDPGVHDLAVSEFATVKIHSQSPKPRKSAPVPRNPGGEFNPSMRASSLRPAGETQCAPPSFCCSG